MEVTDPRIFINLARKTLHLARRRLCQSPKSGMAGVFGFIISLSVVFRISWSLVCPTPFVQPSGTGSSDASFSGINLYLDERDFNGVLPARIDLISSSRVGFPFDSLETLQVLVATLPSIPSSFTEVPVHLEVDSDSGTDELYFTASVWSLDSSLAPPACAVPSLSTISPGHNISLQIRLPCSGEGVVIMQFCLTVGTEPFHLLNGTYQTFTIFFPRTCEGETVDVCRLQLPSDIVPAELCLSVNETLDIVDYGAGGWSLLLGIYQTQGDRGYCFVARGQPNGITPALANDTLSRNFYIPRVFLELDLYIERTSAVNSNAAISFAASFISEDESILSDPVADVPLTGLVHFERSYISVLMPCNAEGFVRVNISFNTTALRDNVLYRRDISLHFYRSCLLEGVLVSDNHLGLKVGIPISILVILTTLVVVIIIALVLLTRRFKKKSYEVQLRTELARLSISNAYISSTYINPFAFLDPYDIEYNYASLEVVSELGEGAFGRVFKARAPGIKRGDYVPQEFVAVKTLKEEAASQAVEEFCKEVKVCVQFEHKNIIRLLGVCTATSQKCMIFEFMDLGNLGELLRLSDPGNPAYPGPNSQQTLITTDIFSSIVRQVANGLNYLSKLKFVHRDIATRNCLVNSRLTVKIADFGMSREVSSMDYYRIGSSKACLPVRWMPPEALMYGKFTLKSDVWSYGVLIWEVYSYGRQPHTGVSNYEVIDRIKEGRLLECPALCPPAMFDIMKSCWTRSPAKRVSMDTIWRRLNQLNEFGRPTEDSADGKAPPSEGYLNLAFAEVISEDELAESKEVEASLDMKREKELADIAELLEDSDDDDEQEREEEGENGGTASQEEEEDEGSEDSQDTKETQGSLVAETDSLDQDHKREIKDI